ncbi:MAG: hypothetical protein AAGN66_01070 [Acidobacteriota bacterium]
MGRRRHLEPSSALRRFAALRRIAVLGLLALLLGGCGDVAVLHDLPETEANSVLAVLQRHGLAATKELDDPETNTWIVSVPEASTARAWSILAEYKLPHRGERRFQDVFGQSKLVVTPLEERALFVEALQGEIAHTLEAVDGVIDARVHLVLPERDLTGRPLGRPKASVVLETQATPGGLEPLAADQVRSIVAHAVGDLDPDSVSVVQTGASVTASVPGTSAGLEWVSVGPLVFERATLGRLKIGAFALTFVVGLLGALLLWQGQQIHRLRLAARATPTPEGDPRPVRVLPAGGVEAGP